MITGKDPKELVEYVSLLPLFGSRPTNHYRSSLKKTAPQHIFLKDLEEKSQLFDTAAAKFSAKASA